MINMLASVNWEDVALMAGAITTLAGGKYAMDKFKNGKNSNKFSRALCDERHKNLDERHNEIKASLEEVKTDMKQGFTTLFQKIDNLK